MSNEQQKMKLIDWSKVPRGVMTNKGELISCSNGIASILQSSGFAFRMLHTDADTLRIVPAARWTYHDGQSDLDLCGLIAEVEFHCGGYDNEREREFNRVVYKNAHAYRITGVDCGGGFTDDPSKVTE